MRQLKKAPAGGTAKHQLTFGWPNAARSVIRGRAMSNVIPFKKPASEPVPGGEIDLLTAVDAAIRDLRDIAQGCDDAGRRQADECRLMLERAFAAVMREA
jgi:hypothetical protein